MTSLIPRCSISIRLATDSDLDFIDALQKLHTKQVGFLSSAILEANIRDGHVLIAEMPEPETRDSKPETRIGYCIGTDRYFKRDDVGIIYQLNVAPGRQRGLIGATLVKAMFERAAYGCRLFCCWCAQDIEANHFWEALGFVPLAYRAGSRGTSRTGARLHIFWERRIRAGDTTTPYWFPSQTSSGALRENRIVLPIPPGTPGGWRDAKPLLLPDTSAPGFEGPKQLPAGRGRTAKPKGAVKPTTAIVGGGLFFAAEAPAKSTPKPKGLRGRLRGRPRPPEPKPKVKNDPRLVAAARELKDRWLEKVNADPAILESNGKYDVSRPPDFLPGAGVCSADLPSALLPAA